jgi:3-oxoacyl-[acyl-carrier-protein] synthase III
MTDAHPAANGNGGKPRPVARANGTQSNGTNGTSGTGLRLPGLNIRGNTSQAPARYAHIIGWGMEVPDRVLDNFDMEAIVETNDEWIRTRTGISERRIAGDKESTGSLALRAARKALHVARIMPADLELVIVATSTPEHIFPSTASQVQDWLGAKRAGAFDLSAACSGFVYALDMAAAKIRAGDIRYALVIGAETMSRVMNWKDRGTCILFGDGAGAVVLGAKAEPGGVTSSVLRSDGSGWDVLGLPTVGSQETYLVDDRTRDKAEDETPRAMHHLHMDGRSVFRFATKVINESIRDVCRMGGITVDDIDLVVPHQANYRILESAARNLRLPIEKFYSNVSRYGNTSAASIPIALCEAIDEGRLNEGDNIIFVGFGGGLTWATMLIEWQTQLEYKADTIGDARRQITYWYAIQRRAIVRRWRRIRGRMGGSPTPNATMRQLREQLETEDAEEPSK